MADATTAAPMEARVLSAQPDRSWTHSLARWIGAHPAVAFCVILTVFATLATYRLTSFPEPDSDGAWDGAPAYTLITEGKLRNPVLTDREFYDQHVVRPRLSLTVLVAAAFELAGVGLWQARMVSVVFGFITLLATWWYARSFLTPKLGLLSCSLLATEGLMLHMSRMIRPEILEAAFAMVGLTALTKGLEKGASWYFVLAGILGGIGLYTHANWLFILVSFFVLLAVHWGVGSLRKRELWIFIASIAAGFLPYAAYLAVQDAPNGFHHFRAQLSQHGAAVLDTKGWLLINLESAFERFLAYIRFPVGVVPFLAGLAGFGLAVFSRDRYIRDVVIVIVTYSIGLAILIQQANAFFFMPIIPLVAILQANLILRMVEQRRAISKERSAARPHRAALRVAGIALACLLFTSQLGRIGGWAWKYRNLDYARYIGRLHEVTKPDDKVWASLQFWWGFYDHDMRSEFTYLREFPSGRGDVPVDVGAVTFRPDLIILTEKAQYLHSNARMRRIAEYLGSKRVLSFDDPYYGHTDVFRPDWAGVSARLTEGK